jgi:hypothetical protein
MMVIPAEQYISAFVISATPAVTLLENTIRRRVSGVSAKDKLETKILKIVPGPTVPVNVPTVIGVPMAVKVLFGTLDVYNCAVMLKVEPGNTMLVTILAYAAICVTTHARGTEPAKLSKSPLKPERLIVPLLKATLALALAPINAA